jgi:cytochrome c553
MSRRATAVLLQVAVLIGAANATPPEPPPGASACTGCHAAKPGIGAIVPRIHGRRTAEIATLMRAYRAGEAPATVMDRIAKGFSEAEIDALAAWFAAQ